MIGFAYDHQEKLDKAMRRAWGIESSLFMTPVEIEKNAVMPIPLVSINDSGEVTGGIGYFISSGCRYVCNLIIINFTGDTTFDVDVTHMADDIFGRLAYQKINFDVALWNQAEPKYDQIILKYGGRAVKVFENLMLPNGENCRHKLYEVTRENYLKKRYGLSTNNGAFFVCMK